MKNTSVKQLNAEIATARKQALTDPHRYERPDTVEGQSLIDMVTSRPMQWSGKQIIDPFLSYKIERIFEKFPVQYKMLGLYHSARFTVGEIAEMEGVTQPSVTQSLRSAKARLKKYLTDAEYDSIRWAIWDPLPTRATPMSDEARESLARYNEFIAPQPVRKGYLKWGMIFWPDGEPTNMSIPTPVQSYTFTHPPEKNLPVPRGILLDEMGVK
jgi:hypothetical protein